jgi:hypothetical protein
MTSDRDDDIETSHSAEHPPDTDIDQYVKECNFRIERMRSDGIWLAAYTDDPDEMNHHYNITVTDDGGLHVTHREEETPDCAE